MTRFVPRRHRSAKALVGAAVLAMTAAIGSAPTRAEEVTLRMHTHVPPVSSSFKTLRAWADAVESDSDGQIRIEMFGAMQLGGKPPDVYDQVKNGVVDIGFTLPGFKAGIFPATSAFELPFIAGAASTVSPAVDEYARTVGAEEWKDIHPIAFHFTGTSVLHMKDKPVRQMEDFRGLKIRTPSRVSADALQALGATPVPIAATDSITEVLMRGVVDGAAIGWSFALAIKVVDVATFHTETTLHGNTLALIMNKDSYAGLPDDLKKAIDDNSGVELSKWLGEQWEIADEPGRQAARSAGREVIIIDPEEEARWRTAAQPVHDAWIEEMNAAGRDGAGLLDEARRLVAKYQADAK